MTQRQLTKQPKAPKAKTHGGARAGAGRPRTNRKRRNIAISDELYEYASQIGARLNTRGGVTEDASDGIEQALAFYRDNAPQSSQERVNALMDRLAAKGIIARRAAKTGKLSPFQPIKVEGEPVSEMIIRERR